MKKIGLTLLACSMLLAVPMHAQAQGERSGAASFFVGCCFGLRTGAAFNEGKNLHFRDWGRLIPVLSMVIGIWDGIESAQGVTGSDLTTRYGAQYY